jgi:hypothetical protein
MRAGYTCLAEHPDLAAIQAVLARIPVLSDTELRELAAGWRNTPRVAKARSRALAPDTPLVIEVLRSFDDIAHLFAEDLEGEADHLGVEPKVVSVALKAVRDAVAAAITSPVLSRRDAGALATPWRMAVHPVPIGSAAPSGRVDQLMAAVLSLGERCHDARRAEDFERILCGAITRDRELHGRAITAAFTAAVATNRRRTWSLLRHQVDKTLLAHACRRCPPSVACDTYDRERVSMLCADAVCGVLVADELAGPQLDTLLEPLSGLVPFPRPPLGA